MRVGEPGTGPALSVGEGVGLRLWAGRGGSRSRAGFSSAPRTVPARGGRPTPICRMRSGGPHLQDAPPPVLLVLGEHVSCEECVAVEADAVGPVVIVFELSPVVRAPGTHHLRGEGTGRRDLGPPGRQGMASEVGCESNRRKKKQGQECRQRGVSPSWQRPSCREATGQGGAQTPALHAGGLRPSVPFRFPSCEGESQGLALHTPLASDSPLQVLSARSATSPDSPSSAPRWTALGLFSSPGSQHRAAQRGQRLAEGHTAPWQPVTLQPLSFKIHADFAFRSILDSSAF